MLRPGILRMRGSMVMRLRPCMSSSTSPLSSTPPPPFSLAPVFEVRGSVLEYAQGTPRHPPKATAGVQTKGGVLRQPALGVAEVAGAVLSSGLSGERKKACTRIYQITAVPTS